MLVHKVQSLVIRVERYARHGVTQKLVLRLERREKRTRTHDLFKGQVRDKAVEVDLTGRIRALEISELSLEADFFPNRFERVVPVTKQREAFLPGCAVVDSEAGEGFARLLQAHRRGRLRALLFGAVGLSERLESIRIFFQQSIQAPKRFDDADFLSTVFATGFDQSNVLMAIRFDRNDVHTLLPRGFHLQL